MPLTITPIFRISPPKNMLPLLGQNKKSKALPLFGVLPLLIQKKYIEVYALIRSIAFIRVLLLFGGLPIFFPLKVF